MRTLARIASVALLLTFGQQGFANQGFDGLNESITTAIGTSDDVTCSLNDNGHLTTFQHLSTNGDTSSAEGNGSDLLLYAGARIYQALATVDHPETLR